MPKAKKSSAPIEKVELYDKLIATNPKVEPKGASNLYTSLNGHMFSYLDPSGDFGLRLGDEDRETFLKKYKTRLFEAYGCVMKEYVLVPDALFKNTKELRPYFQASYDYVKTLKPKKTTR